MAIYQAAGAGPLAFLNSANNQFNQVELPLSYVFFTANGIDASSWPDYATYEAQLGPLLAMLSSQGFLAASPTALSGAALAAAGLTATATLSGEAGNAITIQIASPSAANGTANITVTLKEEYDNVTPATLGTVLGTSAAGAAGLVYDATTGSAAMPEAFTGAIGAGMNVSVLESDGTTTAFTLGATLSADAADAELIQIDVVPAPGPTPSSFTLTVSWTKTASGVSLAALTTTATNPFSYLVTFSGTAGPVPAAGTVTLSGGNSSLPASASLLANS